MNEATEGLITLLCLISAVGGFMFTIALLIILDD